MAEPLADQAIGQIKQAAGLSSVLLSRVRNLLSLALKSRTRCRTISFLFFMSARKSITISKFLNNRLM